MHGLTGPVEQTPCMASQVCYCKHMSNNTTASRTINVATEPDENAPTFEQVIQDAERTAEPFIDHVTPEGHFGVTVYNIGGVQTYWFAGDLADPQARVVARTQIIRNSPVHYLGGSFLGGRMAPQYLL